MGRRGMQKAENGWLAPEGALQSLVQASPMGIYLYELDASGELILRAANPAADRMTGIANQPLLGRTIEAAFPALRDTEVPRRYREVARDGGMWQTRTLAYEDERIRGVYDVVACGIGPLRVAVMFLEVTEREQTAAALAESQTMLRLILDTIPVRVFWTGREGRYLGCNAPFARDLGLADPEAVVGQLETEFPWQGWTAPKRRHDRGTLTEGKAQLNVEEPGRSREGEARWLRTSKIPLRDASGAVRGLLGCYEDVTEQRRAREALQASEERYRLLFENAGEAIILAGPEGFLDCNERALDMFGCTRADLEHTTALDFSPERQPNGEMSASAYAGRIRDALAGQTQRFEWSHRRRDGHVFPAEVSLNALQTQGGVILQSLIRDISERKRAEDERARYHERLEDQVRRRTADLSAANRELESFAYSVSHDLRAPLRSLDGFGQALLEDYGERLDETGRDYLTRIRRAAARMDRLIDDLLGLSRVTRRPMSRGPVNLSALAERIVTGLRRQEPQRRVEVTVAAGLAAHGDPGLLEILLQNLLANAWKFTRERDPSRIRFRAALEEGQTVYTVSDNGAGFDMRYADQLFGVFQRLHGVREFEGTGVGLATVQRIVRRHGGWIRAEGRVDEGATFHFTLEEPKPSMGQT